MSRIKAVQSGGDDHRVIQRPAGQVVEAGAAEAEPIVEGDDGGAAEQDEGEDRANHAFALHRIALGCAMHMGISTVVVHFSRLGDDESRNSPRVHALKRPLLLR